MIVLELIGSIPLKVYFHDDTGRRCDPHQKVLSPQDLMIYSSRKGKKRVK
jgi:hypothetical protein